MFYVFKLDFDSNECYKELKGQTNAEQIEKRIFSNVSEHKEEYLFKGLYNCAEILHEFRLEDEQGYQAYVFEHLHSVLRVYNYQGNDISLSNLYLLAEGNILFRQGQYLCRKNMYDKKKFLLALSNFEKVKNNEADDKLKLIAIHNCGKCYRELFSMGIDIEHNFESAITSFTDVRKLTALLNEEFYKYLCVCANINLGICFLRKSEYEKAFTEFKQANSILIENEEINNDLKGDLLNIIRDEFVELEKGLNIGAQSQNGVDLYKIDNNAEKSLLLQVLINLGITKRKLHCLEHAITIFSFINQRIDKNNDDSWNNLSVSYRKMNKLDEAIKCFQKNLPEDGDSKEKDNIKFRECKNLFAKINNVKCRIKKKDFKEVEEDLDYLYQENEKNIEIKLLRGLYYRDQRYYDKALKIFKDIYEENPELRKGTISLKAYYSIGVCYMSQYRFKRAMDYFERILENEGNDVLALLSLGWCYQNLNNYDKAISYYSKLEDIIKTNVYAVQDYTKIRLFNNLGDCNFYKGNIEEALACYSQLKDYIKDNGDGKASMFCKIANCLKAKKDYLKAIDSYEDSLRMNPFDEIANSMYIECLYSALSNSDIDRNNQGEITTKIKNCLKQTSLHDYSLFACLKFFRFIEKYVDIDQKNDLYKEYCRLFMHRKDVCYSSFYRLLQHTEGFKKESEPSKGKILGHLVEIYLEINKIKNKARVKFKDGEDIDYYHYTNLSVLKKLLTKEDIEQPPHMRLWNSAYMNDSSEGEIFFDLLRSLNNETTDGIDDFDFTSIYNYLVNHHSNKTRPSRSNVYMTSFSENYDSIYMWVLYADKANGCSISFESDFFDVKYENENEDNYLYTHSDYSLYQVYYLNLEMKEYTPTIDKFKENLQDIIKLIKQVADLLNDYTKDDVFAFIINALNEIRFLFKNQEYCAEKEFRIIFCSDTPKVDEKNFEIPRLYIDVERDIVIKEVQLGPKVTDMNEIVPWLSTANVGAFTKSSRHYR